MEKTNADCSTENIKLSRSEKTPKSMSSLHSGHRERVRQSFIDRGCTLSGMYEHQVLEMLLFYCQKRADVNPLAHKLLNYFGSLYNVLNADKAELSRFGLSDNTIMLIKLSNCISTYSEEVQYKNSRFTTLDSIIDFSYKVLGKYTDEKVCVICLNVSQRLLHYECIDFGLPSKSEFPRRRIIEIALHHNAVNLVIAHNHPSGVCSPSTQDINSTELLYQMLFDLNIRLVEHVIVAYPHCYAVMNGYIKDITASGDQAEEKSGYVTDF